MEDLRCSDDVPFETCVSCEALVEAGSFDHVDDPADGANLCKICAADEWLFRCPHCGEIMRLNGPADADPDFFMIRHALVFGSLACPLCEEAVLLGDFHVDITGRLKRAWRVGDLRRRGSLSLVQAERQAAREIELKKEELG